MLWGVHPISNSVMPGVFCAASVSEWSPAPALSMSCCHGHPLFPPGFSCEKATRKSGNGMSENHAQRNEGYSHEYQIKRRGTQPGFELFPLLPKKISDQDVTDGIGRRPGEIVKKKASPGNFRHAGQQVGRDGRKQGDEPRNENSLDAMPFEESLRPLQPFRREMEPVNLFQTALAQPPSQPKGTTAAQETGRRSRRHGLPQRTCGFPQDKSGPQENRFSGQGQAEVVQEHNDKDEHISVMRDVGQ